MAQRYEIDFDLRDSVKFGEDGATFIPEVSEEGIISWTNNKGLPNPESRSIMGPPGKDGQIYINIVQNPQGGDTYNINTKE